jgi:hypothetical protein
MEQMGRRLNLMTIVTETTPVEAASAAGWVRATEILLRASRTPLSHAAESDCEVSKKRKAQQEGRFVIKAAIEGDAR